MQCMMNYRCRKGKGGNEKRGVLTTTARFLFSLLHFHIILCATARPSNIVLSRKPAQSRLLTLKTVLCDITSALKLNNSNDFLLQKQ